MIERYSRPEMAAIWSDASRYATWLEVELAVCRAMERRGIVPAGSADAVEAAVRIDPERVRAIESRTRHDVIAFLTHLEEQAGEAARWLHLGLTSSDVLDTAFAIQLQRAGKLLAGALARLRAATADRARRHARLPMVGRSHGIHAEPTTVGVAFAGFTAEVDRQRARLAAALDGLRTGKIAGAVGVYGNVDPEVEAEALAALGLRPEPCATQVVPRDRHAAFFSVLAGIGATVERLAVQVRHWQRTEVNEAREPFGGGQKGSSAMPHKRNPILSENATGIARLLRAYGGASLENVALWHERDISHSSVERVIAPDATIALDFVLHRMAGVVEGLEVDEAALARNLALTGGLIFSEAVLLALVRAGLPRQRAYEMVQRHAMAAQAGEGRFSALLAADPEVTAHLPPAEIARCFDLDHHLRHAETIIDRALAEGERQGT